MNNYIKEFLLANLKTNPVIIEAGTASGYDTKTFCEMFPNGRIYGFEPIPELFKLATESVKNFNNVTINNKALSDRHGIVEMYVSDLDGEIVESSSILEPKAHITYHPRITFKQKINVEGILLDEFLEENNIIEIDLLWLDLQGFESFILKNSPKTLARTQDIFTEINLTDVYDGVTVWSQFEPYMESEGFKRIWDDISPNVEAANALFKKV